MLPLYFNNCINVLTGKGFRSIAQLKLPHYVMDVFNFETSETKPFDFELDCKSEIKDRIFHAINNVPNGNVVYLTFPEHGLHSAMVVELARFILHIHATRRVEFIILTQNLDLMQALYYIQNSHNVPRIHFCLKDDENEPDFYQQDGIDKIFGSHNKALDLIAKYGKETK